MRVKAQIDQLLDLTIDDALSLALAQVEEGKLSSKLYEELLSKLGETEQTSFTMGLVDKGIEVIAMKNKKLADLKKHFLALANKQGCIYEDDYHDLCYDIQDARVMLDLSSWIIAAGIPLKKNKPKFETEYKKKVKNIVKNPDVKKLKASQNLNKLIEENKDSDFEGEYLPPWKKKEGQAVDFTMEQGELERAILNWEPKIPNIKEWISAVRGAQVWGDLKSIWDALWKTKEEAVPDTQHEYKEFVELEESPEEELELASAVESTTEEDGLNEGVHVTAIANYKDNIQEKIVTFYEGPNFTVAVAQSPEQQSAGLEVFEQLDPEEGMIFPFASPSHASFHMGSVKFPIDILFLMDNPYGFKVAKIIHNAQPGVADIWSNPKTTCVLELLGGTAKKYNIKIGSLCEIK